MGRDRLHDLPGEFTVLKCRTCGLMRTSPRPTPESIGFYYPDDYGPHLGTRVPQSAEPAAGTRRSVAPALRRLFNFNTTPMPRLPPGRMLEIGCASGAFLHEMAERGWQVQGIESSAKAARAAAALGYSVHAGPLETSPRPEEPFDFIVGWMVLEHVHDPVGGLGKLREWARPGAWLVLSVPNAGSLEFRVFKDRWYALQLPTHLHHFTKNSLNKVLSAGGWEMVAVRHQRVLSNLVASMGYVLCDRGHATLGKWCIDFPERGGRWPYALYPLAWLLSIFGQTGRMTVWARASSRS